MSIGGTICVVNTLRTVSAVAVVDALTIVGALRMIGAITMVNAGITGQAISVTNVMTVIGLVTTGAVAVVAVSRRAVGGRCCLTDRNHNQLQQNNYGDSSYYFLHGSSLLTIRRMLSEA